jgi:dTDP-4-amino-4,6-dideoxygalactose transaminase
MKNPPEKPIPVIKTALPPLEEYIGYLQGIWERRQLTNNGPLVKELEARLATYLGVKHCLLVSSGTIALQMAIKALQLKGQIITTPFSFVATSSAIVWEGCQPVYTDIDSRSLCINPAQIEAAISPETCAILAAHVYGHPCDVEQIQDIANKYQLKVIYDAAHAFGVKYKEQSLLDYGDISTLSFHATKLFYTGEGGAIICNNDDLAEKIRRIRDFGINGPEAFFNEVGINAKMSEFHAALGLCVLPTVSAVIERRKSICTLYERQLKGSNLTRPNPPAATDYNYAYYPVLFTSEASLKKTQKALNDANIFPRRYFYPLLNKLAYVNPAAVPVAEDVASRVLCLPLYVELANDEVMRIADLIMQSI